MAEIAGELNHGSVAITNERQARAIKPVLRDHGPEVAARPNPTAGEVCRHLHAGVTVQTHQAVTVAAVGR